MEAPRPAGNQVRVAVRASSVSVFDAGLVSEATAAPTVGPVVLGHDFAGVVEEVGEDVTTFREGQEVFGFVARGRPPLNGTWADYVLVAADGALAPKPATVGYVEAATMPVAATLAGQAVDAVEVGPGETVLVIGASSAIGGFAIQLAADRGANVVATSLAHDENRIQALGASTTFNGGEAGVADRIRADYPLGVDCLIQVSGPRARHPDLTSLLRRDGRSAITPPRRGEGRWGERPGLSRLALLAEQGRLRSMVQGAYALEDAHGALEEFAAEGGGSIALLLLNGKTNETASR